MLKISRRTFTEKVLFTINNSPACIGEQAQALHLLSQSYDRLRAVIDQAQAQFRAGDTHATFNKQFIESLDAPET